MILQVLSQIPPKTMRFFTGETFPYAYNLEVMAADPPSVVESHGKQLNCQGVMIRNGAQRILQSAVGQFRKRPNVVSPAFPKKWFNGAYWGGIKLDAKMYGKFEGFPQKKTVALFGLVILL